MDEERNTEEEEEEKEGHEDKRRSRNNNKQEDDDDHNDDNNQNDDEAKNIQMIRIESTETTYPPSASSRVSLAADPADPATPSPSGCAPTCEDITGGGGGMNAASAAAAAAEGSCMSRRSMSFPTLCIVIGPVSVATAVDASRCEVCSPSAVGMFCECKDA